MAGLGALTGVLEGDALVDQANRESKDLLDEGKRLKRNAYGEARNIEVEEDLASGKDTALEVANNTVTGMSEFSGANQLLAANRQAAMMESKRIIEEGERMEKLFRDRAKATERAGKANAERAIVNGVLQGAVTGATIMKGKK